MTKHEAKIIVALANCQLSPFQAAASLNYHRNTIYYHVKKIRKSTGLDPYDFFDMQKLYPMAKEELQ
jgi:sugar diacid utilization regulator